MAAAEMQVAVSMADFATLPDAAVAYAAWDPCNLTLQLDKQDFSAVDANIQMGIF